MISTTPSGKCWVKNRRHGCSKHCKAAKARGATWQVLGQQVLMGKLNIPVIPPEELAKIELSEYAKPRVAEAQQLAPYGLPSNLDAWDGYPAAKGAAVRHAQR